MRRERISLSEIVSSDNYAKLKNVIQAIKKHRCIAFIGAGFSKSENYRDWKEVIFGSKGSDGSVIKPGLIQYTFEKEEYTLTGPTKKLIDIAEDCKIKNNIKYGEFILKEFGRGLSPSVHNKNHIRLWKIPFVSIFTTNFDPCLYDSGRENNNIKVFCYPYLRLPIVNNGLYHLHGLAFDTGDDIDLLNTIILSRSEYENAYKVGKTFLTDLFYYTMQNYTILFLGFSMDDPVIMELFKDIYQNFQERIAIVKSTIKIEIKFPSHFILFPQNEPNQELRKDLENLNIQIINYNPLDNNYIGLDYILLHLIEDIQESFIQLPSLKDVYEIGEKDEK